jgi:hypothetical protein
VAAEDRASFQGTEGVLFLGKAQEKVFVFRTEKRTDAAGKKYPWIVKSTAMVNQLYFYCVDEDFSSFFFNGITLIDERQDGMHNDFEPSRTTGTTM